MNDSLNSAESILAIDVGEIHTRASLFDVVDGRFRFLGYGYSPTTVNPPIKDIGVGVGLALENLQTVTGRTLIGAENRLLLPSTAEGYGVDAVTATLSAGPPLNVIAVGLVENVSLESARRLAHSTYSRIDRVISLHDRLTREARIDVILRSRPDVIIAAGGTDGGADKAVLELLEAVGLASYILPDDQRPEVLYTGNQAVVNEIKPSIGGLGHLHVAANIRPEIDMERLDGAEKVMVDIYRSIKRDQIDGVQKINVWAGGGLLPTASAIGRVIRFLSRVYDSDKGVLGVDIGASAMTLASAFAGKLTLGVHPQLGLGEGVIALFEDAGIDEITRWMYMKVPREYIREYIYNKAMYPGSLPSTLEDLEIEQALARFAIQTAVKRTLSDLSPRPGSSSADLLPWYEPIIGSGSVLTRSPNLAQSVLMLIDGLQPIGVTTVVLDQYHLMPALGATAEINPVVPVQVLESGAFMNLATVISPIGNTRQGKPILHLRMIYANGNEISVDVKQGTIEILPLPAGQTAQIHLRPLHRFDIGMGGPGRGGGLRVVGGALGVIVDGRGRPLQLPDDSDQRRELINQWRWTLGC